MRAYTVGAAALALDVPAKWLDNLLSHHTVPGVHQARQGIQRRLTPPAVLLIAVARQLMDELSVPTHQALSLASVLCTQPENPAAQAGASPSTYRTGLLTLSVDLTAIQHDLTTRLAQAIEMTPTPRRGRPPGPPASSSPK